MKSEQSADRRGTRSIFWSDNVTNFFASDKELHRTSETGTNKFSLHHLLRQEPSENLILRAPRHGGVWERSVSSFKHVFYVVPGNRRLTDESLATTFCLVEKCLIARPLVPASADATNLEALTPNHFQLGTLGTVLPSHQQADIDHR